MPRYTVEDERSGKRITFEWNAPEPPSDADMEAVFAEAERAQPTPIPSRTNGVISKITDAVSAVNYPAGLAAKMAARAGEYAYRDPRGAALNVLDALPAAGAIVAPLAVTLPTGGAAIPAAVAASGAGAAGGEAVRQMGRRFMGEDPAPPVPVPIPFSEKTIPRIPGVNPEASNIIQQGAIGGAQEILGQALKLMPALFRKSIGIISPAKAEEIAIRYKNPREVAAALTREQLGNSLVASMNDLSAQIGQLDDAARATLSAEKTIPKADLIRSLADLKARYVGEAGSAISSEAKAAISAIDNAIDGVARVGGDVADFRGSVSQLQLKDVIRQFRNIDWSDPAKNALKDVRTALDQALKSRNPQYAQAMREVAKKARLQDVAARKLGVKYDPQSGSYATDATAGKWTTKLLEGKRPETSAVLRQLAKETGNDLLEKFKFTNVREVFSGGKTQGSRMVNLGRYVGGVPGAVIGAALDKSGGAVSGAMLDVARTASESALSPLNPMTGTILMKSMGAAKALKRRDE